MPDCQSRRINRVQLCDLTIDNVKCFRRVNQIIFPVNYNDKFYKDAIASGPLAKVVTFNDNVVGGVCCRIDSVNHPKKLYIMTLGCLAPYRRIGIGSLMLNHVLNYAELNGFDGLLLHVQTNNEIALAFYKKFGFEIIDTREGYYKKISPSTAFVLQKDLKKR